MRFPSTVLGTGKISEAGMAEAWRSLQSNGGDRFVSQRQAYVEDIASLVPDLFSEQQGDETSQS